MVDKVGAPYRVLLYQPSIRFSLLTNSKVLSLQQEVQMENDKVKIVKKWKTLTKIKKVKSFLGFANFYRYFIKNFSHITKPFNKFKEKK